MGVRFGHHILADMTHWAPSFTEDERAFLQQRVALFFKVIFLIALIPDGLRFVLDPMATVMRTGVFMDLASTALFGGLWLICRKGQHPAWALLTIEWVGLLTFSLLITITGRYLVLETLAYFFEASGTPDPLAIRATDAFVGMICVAGGGLLFTLRAAVIPSPPLAAFGMTLFMGTPYVAMPLFFAPTHSGVPSLRTGELPYFEAVVSGMWWLVISAGSAVISRVVFGLRAEVREARRLGQYTLETKLGEGGMGVVYRARHGMMRRPTAVKLLKSDQAGDTNLKRFEREVQLTARLTHPHTITIFDYGRTPDGVFYYAMELLEGASLERVVSVFGPLPPARVAYVLIHVSEALTEAHDVGLIHRDIKPANIFLSRQGGIDDFPKVLDFGLVKDVQKGGDVGLTQADVVAGTPLYLAPEAITAPDTMGHQSDLYALGAVGYFALTGKTVFAGKTLVEVCSHHLHTAPEPPSDRVEQPVPEALERLILDCLEKDPKRRPAGAREVRERLEACIACGTWTADDARRWWTEHGEALATAPEIPSDSNLTLTRQRSD